MKNRILSFFLFVVTFYGLAQNTQNQWESYFSYKNNTALLQYSSNVVIANNISFYRYNLNNFDKQHFSSTNGLNTYEISSLNYSLPNSSILIGNTNGLINIYNTEKGVFSVITGIATKNTLLESQKRINAITEFDDITYLATNYGITELYLNNNLLGDTYYIGNSGEALAVLKVLKINNSLYAITRSSGIKKASLNSSLLSYQNWLTIDWGYWNDGVVFNNQLILSNVTGQLHRLTDSNTFQSFHSFNSSTVCVKNIDDKFLLVASKSQIKLFDTSLNVIKSINFSLEIKDAAFVNNKFIVATANEGSYEIDSNTLKQQNITPSGPDQNNIFKIKFADNNLWVVYGDYSASYNPYPLDYYGVSYFNRTKGWTNFTNTDALGAISIVAIEPHPKNKNKVYFGSFFSGVLENSNLAEFKIFNQANTEPDGLQGIYPNQDIRIGALDFDTDQNLWILNTRASRPLVVMKKDATWQNYSLNNYLNVLPQNESYGNLIVDNYNTKWIGSFFSGLIGFNEKQNRYIVISNNSSASSLPSTHVTSLALDQNNQLWIGTDQGLRVSSSVNRFVADNNLTVSPIVFLEDGVAQELFSGQNIKDIEVDGSNNKWISILDAGVFQVSEDGQQVLNRFNTDNSPLQSNTINDIEINGETGEVFFATNKGLFSFKGNATSPNDNLDDVYIYPNPVRPGFSGDIKISGLMKDAIVKITDISGNLVFETTATGGTVLWNQTAFNKHKVASGVYMVFITHVEQRVNKTKKIMIIR